ncbi:MAG: tetratricopeptide repeat protein, partial [Myxococcaceae bacterium]
LRRGEPAGVATDVYSFSATLFEALYGSRPGDTLEWPSRPRLPERLCKLLRRGLALSPQERFRSCAELADSLREVLHEPSRRKRRRLVALALGASISVTLAVLAAQRAAPCLRADAEWKAFGATDGLGRLQGVLGPHASGVWGRLGPRLKQFGEEWKATWADACWAARGASQTRFVAQESCLKRSAAELAELTQRLAAQGPGAAELVVDALSELKPPRACLEAREGQNPRIFGHDPLVDEIEVRLSAARSLGQLEESYAEADRLLSHARRIGNRELEAEALYADGVARALSTAAPARSVEALRQAARLADGTAQDGLRIRALAQEAFVQGTQLRQLEPALARLEDAESALRRMSGDEELTGLLLYVRATLMNHQGNSAAAEKAYRSLIAARLAKSAEPGPELLQTRMGLARAVLWQQRTDEAVALYKLALADAKSLYGEAHPRTASAWSDLGSAHFDAAQPSAARAAFEQALAGPSSGVNSVITRIRLGQALIELGEVEEGRAVLEGLNAQNPALPQVPGSWRGPLLICLSRAESASGRLAEAERYAEQGVAALAQLPEGSNSRVAAACELAAVALAKRELIRAREQFESVVAKAPGKALCGHLGLLRVDLAQGRAVDESRLEEIAKRSTGTLRGQLVAQGWVAWVRARANGSGAKAEIAAALARLEGRDGLDIREIRQRLLEQQSHRN